MMLRLSEAAAALPRQLRPGDQHGPSGTRYSGCAAAARNLPAFVSRLLLWLPRNVLHGFVVSAEGPCTILTITTPAGFAGFVAEVGAATTTTDRLPEPSEPDIPRLVEIAGRYGIEFPPPPND